MRAAAAAGPRLTGLGPVLAAHTRLMVLGSFPGQRSLAEQQYYAHPRNQFWPILSAVWEIDLRSMSYEARLEEVRRRGLGLWDVHAACERQGSLDSAIRQPQPNDLAGLLRQAPGLRGVAHNGAESARSMRVTAVLGLPVWRLPSTSPAHAAWSFERKLAAWREVMVAAGVAA